jgi:hypothetical protein
MDEIDVLSKRFKDFVDKVQAAFDKTDNQKPDAINKELSSDEKQPVKLYTVVSPVETMTSNLKNVLNAIDTAIDNIDRLQDNDERQGSKKSEEILSAEKVREVTSPDYGQKKFTEEELDFLVRTFNKILNTTEEERKKLFMNIDKSDPPPDNGK